MKARTVVHRTIQISTIYFLNIFSLDLMAAASYAELTPAPEFPKPSSTLQRIREAQSAEDNYWGWRWYGSCKVAWKHWKAPYPNLRTTSVDCNTGVYGLDGPSPSYASTGVSINCSAIQLAWRDYDGSWSSYDLPRNGASERLVSDLCYVKSK